MSGYDPAPLPRLIYFTAIGLQGHADEVLRPYDLTLEQYLPLKILLQEGGSLGQRPLCEEASKTPANMTRILDRLENKGFIERHRDNCDRRAYIIHLTAAGEKLVKEVADLFAGYLSRIMAGIDPADEECCLRVLEQLRDNLRQGAGNAM